MRLIDADELEFDTEWSEYMDGWTSYSQLQIDGAPIIDAAKIQKLCYDIEDIVNEIAACAETIDFSTHKVILDKLKEIRKELTGNADD